MNVFISHSAADNALVEDLRTELKARGYDVFLDKEIKPGANWHLEIGKALEESDAEEMVVSILSHDPNKRRGKPPVAGRSGLSSLLAQLPDSPATVVLISDCMHLSEGEQSQLVQASHYHKLICCVVEDAREIRVPNASGQVTLVDMSTGRQETMSFAEADKLVREDHDARIAALTDCFRRARAQYGFFEGGDSPTTMRNKIMRMLQGGA